MSGANVVEDANIDDNGDLILSMSNGDEINAGNVTRPSPTIQEVYIEDSNIKVRYDDGSIKDAGPVSTLGVKDVDEVYLDGYDVYVKYYDGTTEKVGNVFFQANSEIFTTYMNRDDGYMYGIRYNGEIETIGDLERYVGDRFSENITKISSNDLEEVILHTSDNKEYNIGKVYFKDYSSDSSLREISNVWVDAYSSTLKVTYSDGTIEEAGPTSYTNINGKPIVLGNAFINEVGHLNLEVLKVDSNGNFVMKEEAVSNPDGTVTYEEVFDTRLIDAGLVKGHDGEDGTVYESVKIQSDGLLSFITDDGVEQIAGFITDRSVIDAYINTDGVLVIKLSDGTEILTSNVLGKDGMDGENISSASIDAEGQLWLHFEDNAIPDIPAGKVDYPVEVSMDSDNDGNIIFTMSNGDTYNVGRIEGVDSKYITDIDNRSDGIYVIYSDNPGEWVNIGNLNVIPEKARINPDGSLKLEFSNGQTISTPERVTGLDGDGITSISFDGNDLMVSRTINNRESIIEERFENVKGVGIKNIQYDPDNHSIVFTNDLDVNSVILLPTLKDGIGVSGIIQDEKDLVFKMSDGTERVLEDVVGQGIEIESYDGEKFIFKNSVTGEQYIIETIKGSDGNSITDVKVENDKILLQFSDMADVTVDVPKGNIHNKTVDTITRQIVDGEHIIVVSFVEPDEDSIIIPVPLPEDGDDIENAYIDAEDNLVFEISNRSEPVVFPVIKGRDGNDVESVTYNDDTNELIFTTNNGEYPATLPEFNDGLGIADIEYDSSTSELIFSLDNDTTSRVPLPKGTDGVGISDIQYFDDKLHFNLSDTTTKSFPIPKGRDGDSVTDVKYQNQDIIISAENQSDTIIPFRTGVDGKTITDIYLNERDLIIETDVLDETGNPITLTHELLQGKDAVDGVSVESFSVNGDDLRVIMDDGTHKDITGAGKYVSNIEYKNEKLYFTYTNGTTYITDPIKGDPGVGTGITDINIVGNVLNIEISDHSGVVNNLTHDLSSITIEKVEVNDDGDLIVEYKDTTTKNLGRVQGTRQKWMKSATISSNDILTVVLTDGENDSFNILGNVKGAEGVHASEIDIDKKSGDFNMTFSDGSTMLIGNIKDERTLSTWKSTSVPYPKDVVVIHNESMFLSLIDNNNDEPPSNNWKEFALSDNFTEVLKPIPLSPIDGAVSSSRVTLIGKPYNGYSSKRLYREYVVYDIDDNIIFENTRNADSITLPSDLGINFNDTYKWKIRDVSITGFESAWSDISTFSVIEELYRPTIKMKGDKNAMVLTPIITIDPVLSVSTGEEVPITNAMWELNNVDTGEFIKSWSLSDYDLLIPIPTLSNDTNYSIKAMVETTNSSSSWSNPILFKTENSSIDDDIKYIKKPIVGYSGGNPLDIDIENPKFISTFIEKGNVFDSGDYVHIPLNHITSDWEIIDVESGTIIAAFYDTVEKYEICFTDTIATNRRYRIRVRYNTKYTGSSEWSDWLEFMSSSRVDTPSLSVDDLADANNFIPDDYIYISEFSGHNATHTKTEMRVTDAQSGEFYYDSEYIMYSTYDKFKLLVPSWLRNRTLNIEVRHHSKYISSDWSTPLTIKPKTDTYSDYHMATYGIPIRQDSPDYTDYYNGNVFYQTFVAYNDKGFYYKLTDYHYIFAPDYTTNLSENSPTHITGFHGIIPLNDTMYLTSWNGQSGGYIRGDSGARTVVPPIGIIDFTDEINTVNLEENSNTFNNFNISKNVKSSNKYMALEVKRNLKIINYGNKDEITVNVINNPIDGNYNNEYMSHINDKGEVFTRHLYDTSDNYLHKIVIRRYIEEGGTLILQDDLVLDLSPYLEDDFYISGDRLGILMVDYGDNNIKMAVVINGHVNIIFMDIQNFSTISSIQEVPINNIDPSRSHITYVPSYFKRWRFSKAGDYFILMFSHSNNHLANNPIVRLDLSGNISVGEYGDGFEGGYSMMSTPNYILLNILKNEWSYDDKVNNEIVMPYQIENNGIITTYECRFNYVTMTWDENILLENTMQLNSGKQYTSTLGTIENYEIDIQTLTYIKGNK